MKSTKKVAAATKRVSTYEVYPKAGVAKAIMHQNMSSHYRRIYSAKPRIDTGPPFSHKPPPQLKQHPWTAKNMESYKLNIPRKNTSYVSLNSTVKCSRESCGEQPVPTFKPQISKTDTESKLRSLRVYHPPRRRYAYSSSATLKMKSSPEVSVPDIPWIHTADEVKAIPSNGTSSDSAYTEEGEGVWSGGESRGTTPVSDTRRDSRSEDLLYAQFIQDITDEVVRKGVFSDTALRAISLNHIESRKQFLNVERMQEEVEKLQLDLGVQREVDELDCISDFSLQSKKSSSNMKFEDKELMDALSQLNLSAALKADIASTLGLHRQYDSSRGDEVNSSSDMSVNVIHAIRRNRVPQSDDDSYELASEGCDSRPLTPLGLAW